ncbi:MAG: histidine phosphatase family protein [Hyphomonadaceae bacterium]|nr:histidine phosphatase family protein [Hyphomonadaceae bacterium]
MKPDIIILARHGEPDLSRRVYLNWRGYKYWWRLYDEAGLKPGQSAPKMIKELANKADVVISSTLPRAIETAEMASGATPDLQEPLLVEAGLPPPNLGYIKLKPRMWGILSRVSWVIGFSGEVESRKDAKIRAQKAADILSDHASGGKMLFVAAHGWFNRMIRPQLKRRGFKCVEDHGDLHWSYRRYERVNNKNKDE